MELFEKFEIENRKRLKDYYNSSIIKFKDDQTKIDIIDDFINKIKVEGKATINVDVGSLFEIINTGKYLNVFELGYGNDAIEEKYDRETNAPYFKKLNFFVDLFDKERKIKYALLNIGNLGTNYPSFGSGTICVVLKNDFINALNTIFCLKSFSLNYFSNNGDFREAKFKEEISNWQNISLLAYNKHFKDIFRVNQLDWPNLITNKSGWIEILIKDSINVSSFSEIRIKKNLHNHLTELLNTDNEFLDKMDVIIKNQFISIMKKSERLGIFINSY